MSYTALYRKLRPSFFSEVIGQEHIVRTLKNQLMSGRISHAYLFCGTRGTGKTSTAKIFAKVINCLSHEDGEPCNACDMCTAANAGISMNIIEIDAASNNGVENIRDIREEVKYPPTEGKYKIYIVDEVHMLSTGAFNALLKTLEEPPEHVIFILATTDPQKIPPTIHSRCQRFDFRRIMTIDMADAMERYMQEEGVSADRDALMYIASISDGAMRDALSILEQCISFYYGETLDIHKVLEIVGSVDSRVFFSLTNALYSFDSKLAIEIINELVVNGRDINQFVTELLRHLRDMLVAISVSEGSKALDYGGGTVSKLKAEGEKIGAEILMSYINEFSRLQGQIKYAPNERILLELSCIKLCNPFTEEKEQNLYSRLKYLEDTLAEGFINPLKQEHTPLQKPLPKNETKPKETNTVKATVKASDTTEIKERWDRFVAGFCEESNSPVMKNLIKKAKPSMTKGGVLLIAVNETYLQFLKDDGKEDIIKAALAQSFGEKTPVSFVVLEEYEKDQTSGGALSGFDFSDKIHFNIETE